MKVSIVLLLILLLLWVFITQILIPMWQDDRLFPAYRKSSTDKLLERARRERKEAEAQLKAVQELEEARKIDQKVNDVIG